MYNTVSCTMYNHSLSEEVERAFLKVFESCSMAIILPDVAQSKAVSPAPSTMTVPNSSGNWALQAHIPGLEARET